MPKRVGFARIYMDIQTSFFITAVVAMTLALLLFFIKVPSSPYARRLGHTKNAIAGSFALAGLIFIYTMTRIDYEWNDFYPAMMMFVVTALSSVILFFAVEPYGPQPFRRRPLLAESDDCGDLVYGTGLLL